mgnify:CR=1 FL=1
MNNLPVVSSSVSPGMRELSCNEIYCVSGAGPMELATGWVGTTTGAFTGAFYGGLRGIAIGGLGGFVVGAALGAAVSLATGSGSGGKKPTSISTISR